MAWGVHSHPRMSKSPSGTGRVQSAAQPPPTERQVAVLRLIHDHVTDHGYPPTMRELAAGMRWKSTNSVESVLVALERKGCIERAALASRGLRLLPRGLAWIGAAPFVRDGAAGPITSAVGSDVHPDACPFSEEAARAVSQVETLCALVLADDPEAKVMAADLTRPAESGGLVERMRVKHTEGGFDLHGGGWVVRMLASTLGKALNGAPNYLEQVVELKPAGAVDTLRVLVTVVRPGARTPSQLRAAAEARVAALEAEVAALRAAAGCSGTAPASR